MAKCSALDKIYLSLVRFLNVSNLKPYLKQKQLLTDEELEQLQCTATSQTTAETLIKILKRKGPNHDRELLSALKDSMELDPHQGHISIIADLEEALAKQELTKFMEQPESDEGEQQHIQSYELVFYHQLAIKLAELACYQLG